MIIIYYHNDSGQYYKTMIMIISYAPNFTLSLASVVNYIHKQRHKIWNVTYWMTQEVSFTIVMWNKTVISAAD